MGKGALKCGVAPAPRHPSDEMNHAQGASGSMRQRLRRLNSLICAAREQNLAMALLFSMSGIEQQPKILDAGSADAVVEVDEKSPLVTPENISKMAIAMQTLLRKLLAIRN